MSDPALDFFNKLSERSAPKEKDDKAYPGNTPPRNLEGFVDRSEPMWLNTLPHKNMVISQSGQEKRLYPIGSLAAALGKKAVTIRSWEQKGWLPPVSYRTPTPAGDQLPGKQAKGQRLYSKEQIIFLVESYYRFIEEPDKENWKGFRSIIKTKYPKR